MKTLNIDGNIICYNSYNLDSNLELQKFLKEDNLRQFLGNISQKIVLVLGGDGTMLNAIRDYYKEDIPFFGINFGSKGFLLNDKNYINKSKGGYLLGDKDFITRDYFLLEIKQDKKFKGIALNDINIYSPNGKLVEVNISLSNKQQIAISGDGAIISTPAGSTGHNKSYNGPMLPHTSSHLIITPKGTLIPHTSKVIEGNNTIYLKNTGRKNTIGINADGNHIFSGKEVSIEISKSEKVVQFLILENYIQYWDNKVLWEQGFDL